MTPAITKSTKPLDSAALRHAALFTGPCITLVIPARRPGTSEPRAGQLVRSLVQHAAEQVASLRLAEAVPMIKRLEEFAASFEPHAGASSAFVIFSSPEGSAQYEVAYSGPPRVVLASYPLLRPFVAHAHGPSEAAVLCVSRNLLRLLDFSAGVCHERPLPPGVPASLGESGGFDQPDHRREGRSPSVSGVGSMGGVRFTTATDRESRPDHIEHFFALVDREMRPALAGKPLLLAGVEEEVAAYRRVARYPNLVEEELHGNWDLASLAALGASAAEAFERGYQREANAASAAFAEKPGRALTLTDGHETLISAADGRVHQLLIDRDAELPGKLPPDLDRVRLEREDLINAAVVETLRHGGDVLEVSAAPSPIAAVLRY